MTYKLKPLDWEASDCGTYWTAEGLHGQCVTIVKNEDGAFWVEFSGWSAGPYPNGILAMFKAQESYEESNADLLEGLNDVLKYVTGGDLP